MQWEYTMGHALAYHDTSIENPRQRISQADEDLVERFNAFEEAKDTKGPQHPELPKYVAKLDAHDERNAQCDDAQVEQIPQRGQEVPVPL